MRSRAAAALVPVVLYLLLASFHAGDAFTNDETWEFYASKTLLEEGRPKMVWGETNVLHPHGYYYLVSWAFGLFGVNEAAARGVGMAASVLCYLVILRMVRVLSPNGEVRPRTYLLAGLFYLFSPLVIQGSLVITADTGIHQLLLMLFLLYFIERHPFAPVDYAVLPILFAMTLWAKVVTPCLVLSSIVLYLLFSRRWKESLLAAVVVGGGGFLLFLGSWTLHCRALDADPLGFIAYLWKVLTSRKVGVDPRTHILVLARGTLVLLVWLGLPYALLMLQSLLHLKRRGRLEGRPMAGLLLLIGTVLLLAHTLVSGIGYGFPRYHFTMLPIWAVVVTLHVGETIGEARFRPRTCALAGGIAAAYLFLAAGDPLRLLNFDLKASMLGMSDLPSRSAAGIALKLGLLLLPLAAGLALSVRLRSAPRTAAILLVLTAAYSLSLNALQAKADYQTHYCYGETGTREMLAYCAGRLEEGKKVMSCMDVVYHLVDRNYMEDWHWNEKDYLLDRLANRDTQLVVMGVNHNTMSQFRSMADDADLKRVLESSYSRRRIGSYFIWERPRESAALGGAPVRQVTAQAPLRPAPAAVREGS